MQEKAGTSGGLALILFRVVLRLYPRSFREAWANRILEDFAGRLDHETESGGKRGRTAYAVRTILETIPSALRVRVEAATGRASDIRSALRGLRRAPGFSSLSVGVLALGVAGSAIIFSVLYGVILRPLPYADADRLMVVWTFNQRQGLIDGSSYPNMADWAERSRGIEQWAFWYRPDFTARTLLVNDVPLRIEVGAVSASFFAVLGIDPVIGRVFTEEEERTQFTGVLISHAFWMDRFAGSPEAIGASLILDGSAREVIGVMPSEFALPRAATQVWELHSVLTGWPNVDAAWGRNADAFVALGRLSEGTSIERAAAELDAIATDLRWEYPDENRYLGVRTTSLIEELTGAEVPRTLWLLQVAALLVLLAVAANVGQLWVVRALGRRREFGVRLALGARRRQLVRALFTEGMVITLAATVLGVLLARLAIDPLLLLVPSDLPNLSRVSLDPAVVLLTVAAAVAIGGTVALVSAWVASGAAGSSALARSTRTSAGAVRGRLRPALVILQMAVATLLLAGAGLFIRSFQQLQRVDSGMDAEGALVARVEAPMSRYVGFDDVVAFHSAVLEQLRAVPGVSSAGAISDFLFRRFPDSRITPEGRQGDEFEVTTPLMVDFVTPGLVDAAGMRIVRGRDITAADTWAAGSPTSVLVNQAAAEAFWPGEDVVGKRFQWGVYDPEKAWHTIVGVLADARRGGLDERPIAQIFGLGPTWNVSYVLRATNGAPLGLAASVRSALAAVDPNVAVSWMAPAQDLIDDSLTLWRLRTLMAALAATLVAVLAVLGMYGLLNETVLRRRHEIGLRMAVGALPAGVRNRFIRHGVVLAGAGFVMGLTAVASLSRVVSAFLYEVAPFDLPVIAAIGLVVLALAVTASWIPAHRATRIDPARCLSTE